MPCPQMVPAPGGNPAAPAAWNDRVVLVTQDAVGFADFAQLTVTVKSGSAQPRPVTIELATAQSLTLMLPGPPDTADIQGPHSLIVEGPVTGSCTVGIDVRGVALPQEPTKENLEAVLRDLVTRLQLTLTGQTGVTRDGLPSIPPGSGLHGALVSFPPFVTPAGTTLPSARVLHSSFRMWDVIRDRIPEVLGEGGGVFSAEPAAPTSPPGTIPIAPSLEWKLVTADGRELVEGEDYLGDPLGRSASAFTIVPPISKTASTPPQKLTVKVTGSLTAFGSAIGGQDVSVPIPDLAQELLLETLALPVPLFAGFRLEKFAPADGDGALGAVYVQVPSGWADTAVHALMDALDEARELLRPLERIAWLAELILGLRTLSRALSAQSTAVVEAKNVVEDLNHYRWFKHDHWYGLDSWFEDLYVHDRISSFIALGLRNQAVQCFSAKDNDASQEWLEVRFTDPVGMAVVNLLKTKSPENARGRGATVTPQVFPKDTDDQYDDSFSSITLVEG